MRRSAKQTPRLRIVLVRPRNPLNLLAAARAATNFGVDDIVVVAPHPPVWDEAQTKRGALLWLRNARLAGTLAGAVADCTWVLGTSSLARRRKEELPRIVELDHVAAQAGRQKGCSRMALVFGSEKRGLTNEELSLCHCVVRIPTGTSGGSMNLGQAVAVCCYELRAWAGPKPSLPSSLPAAATLGEISRLVDALDSLIGSTQGSDARRRSSRKTRLRRMLLRWSLSSADVTQCLGVLRDLVWATRRDLEKR
jgi:tRNA/rRNA methyltransferase